MLSSLIRREAAREAIGSHGVLKAAIIGAVLLLAMNGCAPTIANYEPAKPCDGSGTPCGSRGGRPPYAATPSGGPSAPPTSSARAAIVDHPNTGKAQSEAYLTTLPPGQRQQVEEIAGQAEEQARLAMSLEKGYPPGGHQGVFDIARTVGYTRATAERCGVPVRPLERLIDDYERTLRTENAVKFGLAIAEGRVMRETSTLRFTIDNCVGINPVLRFTKR